MIELIILESMLVYSNAYKGVAAMSIVPMLIDHCSPTLASLKCGSLFSVMPEDMAHTRREAQALSDALAPKGLSIRVIDVGDGRALCYLYRPGQLCRVLAGEKERAFLTEQGYPDLRVEAAVDLLCARLAQGGAFPHEIGLFLGYPIDDVVAFIAHKGRNCLCCGCWKCYTDAEAAQKAFCRFRKCTSVYKRLFACGRTLDQLAVAA